jgi:pimeloyl-ACP methyl ester carboxylesterase
MTSPSSSAPATGVLAEVRVGDLTTRYRRRGSGRAVVLLCAPGCADGASPPLAELLSADCRVIIPEVPEGVTDTAAWLRDFLDALGIERAAVVVPEQLGIATLDLALLDTGRDERP